MSLYESIEVTECCVAAAIAGLLNEGLDPDDPGCKDRLMVPVVVDCDMGSVDPCCNRVTVTSDFEESRTGSDGNARLYDLVLDVRVTRPKEVCPPKDAECLPDDGLGCLVSGSSVKAERAMLVAGLPSLLSRCLAGCCGSVVVEGRARKLCGGDCSGTQLRVRLRGFSGFPMSGV